LPSPQYHGRAAFDPRIVAEIARVLRTVWDPDGVLGLAASTAAAKDSVEPGTHEEFALTIAGILGAGGSEAEVCGYLRREEERLTGAARSTGQLRWDIAQDAWRAVRGISLPPPDTRA
jgi:hypothetical protein